MPEAAGQREQLRPERGRPPASGVEAPGGPSPGVGGPRERAQARVPAGATVLDRRPGHVQDPRTRRVRAQAFLPLLLVAAVLERGVERSHPFEGAAADRHVRAPRMAGVGVVRAQLERGDGRALAPAGARRATLEAGPDRPGEDVHLRVPASGRQQRSKPAGARADVVVGEHHELALGTLYAGVAGHVQAERARMGLVAGAEARRQLARRLRGAGVVDHEHLGAGLRGVGRDRGQRHLQVGEAATRGNHDRG